MRLKRFAFFLPQFHEIKENNEWWGHGFTEWTNVKAARPLYKGHRQPKKPLDGYYNLLDKKTMIHQTKLLQKYNIDGMVYYHYYFCGKKLLEKPAENLLRWKDIDQKFFFCWANHSWKKAEGGKRTILLEQRYGTEKDWAEHFEYLLPFFKDERYEKRNNKPVFMLFDPNFAEKDAMMEYFDEKCRENGFAGIFVINARASLEIYQQAEKNQHKTSYEQFHFLREPACSQAMTDGVLRKLGRKVRFAVNTKTPFSMAPPVYSGDKILKKTIKRTTHKDNVYHGIFFEWDNTPRHKQFGYIINPISKKTFMQYYQSIKDDEYVFINAWNEWAEGMILEGTEENGYKYLEWLKEVADDEEN